MPELETLRDSAFWSAMAGHRAWIAVAIVAIAFTESFAILGIVVPGVVLLAGCAFLAGGGAMSPWTALGCAWLGAVLGDGVSYLIGHRYRDHVRAMWPFDRHPQWVARGERFFQRHGAISVVIGRFVGPIRPVTPLIAGMLAMRAVIFYPVNVVSAVGWAPVYILPGYLAGASLAQEVQAPPGLAAGLVALAAYTWLVVRGAGLAWRAGEPDGALARALASRAVGRRLLAPAFGAGSSDTRASVLAALTVLLAGGGAAVAVLAALPALEPWRAFAAELWAVLTRFA